MYHIEKGDYVNRYQHYENDPISAFIYKPLGILCISSNVSGAVKLDFLNMEEVANFVGTIKFTNVV